MDIEDELNFSNYLSILKRRWRQIFVAFFVLMAVITAIIISLPSVYKSEGLISIESPVFSEDVVKLKSASNYVDESIDKVKQKVLSRENLLNFNQKYNLFPVNEDINITAKLVSEQIKVEVTTKNTSRNQWDTNQVAVGLAIGFEYSDPDIAFNVANEIVRQFLDENEKSRTKSVTETTTFLTDELNRLKAELEVVENKVAAYKQVHANSLRASRNAYGLP